MRTVPAALAAIALTLGVAAPAIAHPRTEVLPPLTVDLTHEATDNVGFVARFHEHFGSAGGILTSNDWNDGAEFFVVTDPRGVWTYDVSTPESPALLGVALLPQSENLTNVALGQEDPSTDGRLVLLDGVTESGVRGMQIVSIEDPTAPVVVGTYTGGTDHTWTCVTDVATDNGCAYAYGRSDNIIDIRDPAAPVQVATGWKTATGEGGYAHDLTEIRPGLVMHAGAEPVLMDTTDPANPVKISQITLRDHGPEFIPARSWSSLGYHSVEWPRAGEDAFLLLGTEITDGGDAGDDCSSDEAVLETWDARPVLAAFDTMAALKADGMSHEDARDAAFGDGTTVKFERIDAYQASGAGTFLTGQAASNVLYCAHWMEHERDWNDGGRMVAGYYNRGARFIDVAPVGSTDDEGNDISGTMTELGWFTGADAYAGSAQWITDEVVYVMDYVRGMDVIKITDEAATSVYTGTGSVHESALTIAEMDAMGIAPPATDEVPYGAFTVAGLALVGAAMLRRRVTA